MENIFFIEQKNLVSIPFITHRAEKRSRQRGSFTDALFGPCLIGTQRCAKQNPRTNKSCDFDHARAGCDITNH